MVLKQAIDLPMKAPEFENDVKMYGTQASLIQSAFFPSFENDVKMYGTQA